MKRIIIDNQQTNYLVTENGEIWSDCTNRFLSPNGRRYLKLQLGPHGTKYIHRLVAEHYVEKPQSVEVLEVNHIDGDTHNNHYLNLEWVTRLENCRHQKELRLFGANKIVYMYNMNYELEKTFNTLKDAEEYAIGIFENYSVKKALQSYPFSSGSKIWSRDENFLSNIDNPDNSIKPIKEIDFVRTTNLLVIERGEEKYTFKSFSEAERQSESIFGVRIPRHKLSKLCTNGSDFNPRTLLYQQLKIYWSANQ